MKTDTYKETYHDKIVDIDKTIEILKEIREKHGNLPIYISQDEEGNGYHPAWFDASVWFVTPETAKGGYDLYDYGEQYSKEKSDNINIPMVILG